MNGEVGSETPHLADLVVYGVLFAVLLLVCIGLGYALRLAWSRGGPPAEIVLSPQERLLLAARQLEEVGVDLAGILGEWSPTSADPRPSGAPVSGLPGTHR